MIQRERVADNIYADVTAGVVVGSDWAVAIDTLSSPKETLEIRDFIEQELQVPVRYVINTHYHADHSWGNCFFPGALVISHSLCRELLQTQGIPSLEEARKHDNAFQLSKIILPHVTFSEGELTLKVDKKNLRLISLPGHSVDGIGVLIEQDRILFSGDVFMPIPYLVDGHIDTFYAHTLSG
jgi:glyoxylase-like metal-dependent hydrolase (beta-lactamase superfamily II)